MPDGPSRATVSRGPARRPAGWRWPPRWAGDRDGPPPFGRARRWREQGLSSRQVVRELAGRTVHPVELTAPVEGATLADAGDSVSISETLRPR